MQWYHCSNIHTPFHSEEIHCDDIRYINKLFHSKDQASVNNVWQMQGRKMNTVSHFHLKELALLKTSLIQKVEEIPPPKL